MKRVLLILQIVLKIIFIISAKTILSISVVLLFGFYLFLGNGLCPWLTLQKRLLDILRILTYQ